MEKSRGFTLIELLGVVTLIVLISLIVIPNIVSNVNKKKGEISEANMELLGAAAGVYIENHSSMYTNSFEANGSTYCIPVQTLINDGVLETPFKDVSGNEIDYSDVVKATYNDTYNGFEYEFVDSNECTEVIQHISRPEVLDNMIPVVYKDGAWKKADVNSKWYNYLDKKWANAVVVNEFKRDAANSKSRYEYLEAPVGTVINEDDVLGFFVWIPRFRYQVFSSNSPVSINIAFESVGTPKSLGTAPGQWLTHPAFSSNGTELSGIWVGKYEASNINDNIIIKSGTPWTNIDYVSVNTKTLAMTNSGNIYGLNGVNTHMVKNSEWSAVAYLTNSIFGNLSNNSSTGNNTGIYNLSGNKEFVILDNENQYSIGYALGETNGWSNDNSYVTGDNLYLTRGGNSIFNYQNSKVVDPNTTFRVSLINSNSSSQDYKRKYVVSFDPNGGTVSQTSKEVSYHDAYGELPVPTREGYTFKGWNGMNLFNPDVMTITGTDHTIGSEEISFKDNRYDRILNKSQWEPEINKTYTIVLEILENTFDRKISLSTDDRFFIIQYSNNIIELGETNTFVSTFSARNDFSSVTLGSLWFWTANTVTGTFRTKISIFEGDVATEYEPYYITSATSVVQDKNHTLKAIW